MLGSDDETTLFPPPRDQRLTSSPRASETVELLGLRFQNVTLEEAAYRLVLNARQGIRTQAFFVNAHCINVAAHDANYAELLRRANLLYADGIGMHIATRLWGTTLNDNVNGTDLFPLLCKNTAQNSIPIALVGGRPGIAEACAKRMCARYPGLNIALTHHGFHPAEEDERIVRELNESGARILLVAKGVPRQELWIGRYATKLEAPVLMGVGALFDFYSGAIPRSPLFLRRWGLEWLFRLLIEPRRLFVRYIVGNPVFLFRVIRRKLLG